MPQECGVHSDMQKMFVSYATLFDDSEKIKTSSSESARGITKTGLHYRMSICRYACLSSTGTSITYSGTYAVLIVFNSSRLGYRDRALI
jgi:hypothetical protein